MLPAAFTSLSRWLTTPVIEHFGIDRPFRLRRLSLLLLAGGLGVFLVSCLCGVWLVRLHVPIVTGLGLCGFGGDAGSMVVGQVVLQWSRASTEAAGAVLFFTGLASVALFDRRDGVGVMTAD